MTKKESMTSRERWLAVLARQKPDRIPMDYWATPEADDKIKKHLGCASDEELFERLHIDRPVSVSPVYAGPPLLKDRDQYGCMFRDVR